VAIQSNTDHHVAICPLYAGDAPVPNNPSYSWTALSASGWGDFFAVAVDHMKYGDERLAVPQSVFSKGYR
jgi:hypothetical protein